MIYHQVYAYIEALEEPIIVKDFDNDALQE